MVDFVRACFRVSIRRACKAIPLRRSTYHYRSRKPEQAILRKRIREIAETRTRYGYRRIHVLLRREGWRINAKRVYRLYKLEKLQMRHKPPRRRVKAKLREDRRPAVAPNDCWSMDWMYDELFDGRRVWVLTIVDNFSGVSPATIRLDNGSQFTAKELDLWAYANEVVLDFSRPGKPTDNAFSEAFNSRFRLECLNQHWFLDIEDARDKIEAWRQDYNTTRPHGAIGNRVPMDLVNSERSRISTIQTGPDLR